LPIQVEEAFRTSDLTKIKTPTEYYHQNNKHREPSKNIEGCKREKDQITYKGKPIKITADFSTETLKARGVWSEVFQALNENNFRPRILYPAKLSFKMDGVIKIFYNKQKLKQYMTTQP
jgi:hypothetical protein